MSSLKTATQGPNQVGSQGTESPLTASAQLEEVDRHELAALAAAAKHSSRAPGLKSGERLALLLFAEHAMIEVVKDDPGRSKQSKHREVSRRRQRIGHLHHREQESGFELINPPAYRLSSGVWVQRAAVRPVGRRRARKREHA